MKKKEFLYWKYYELEKYCPRSMILGFFDIGDYKDKYIFLHVNENFMFNVENDMFLQELEKYTYQISKTEEDMLLDDMGIKGKRQYSKIIENNGLGENYRLYSFSITDESIYLLTKFLEQTLERPIKINLSNLE